MITTLQELDPQRLAAIHPNDRYRLSRAVEICLAAGRNVTTLTHEHQAPQYRFLEFRMTVPREQLHQRIAQRTASMLQGGWIEETRNLLDNHDESLAGFRTLGYPHVLSHLRGDVTLEEMQEKIVVDTRQLARHQEVWFRKTTEATLLPVGDDNNVAVLQQALEECPDLQPSSS